jgi:hypothetical protein
VIGKTEVLHRTLLFNRGGSDYVAIVGDLKVDESRFAFLGLLLLQGLRVQHRLILRAELIESRLFQKIVGGLIMIVSFNMLFLNARTC